MPKVTMYYRDSRIDTETLLAIGARVKALVAEAVSTDDRKLISYDVDWIPIRYGDSSVAPLVAIEMQTIGFTDRKAKLTREVLLALKANILAIPGFPKCDHSIPLIWVIYTDPDGPHI